MQPKHLNHQSFHLKKNYEIVISRRNAKTLIPKFGNCERRMLPGWWPCGSPARGNRREGWWRSTCRRSWRCCWCPPRCTWRSRTADQTALRRRMISSSSSSSLQTRPESDSSISPLNSSILPSKCTWKKLEPSIRISLGFHFAILFL